MSKKLVEGKLTIKADALAEMDPLREGRMASEVVLNIAKALFDASQRLTGKDDVLIQRDVEVEFGFVVKNAATGEADFMFSLHPPGEVVVRTEDLDG